MTTFEYAPKRLLKMSQKKPRSPSLRTLPPLIVTNALDELDPKQPNLLPVDALGAELQIAHFAGTGFEGAGAISLYLLPDTGKPIHAEPITWPPVAAEFPLEFRVSLNDLGGHGAKHLRYIATNAAGNNAGSGELLISVDRLAPNNGINPLPLILPDDLAGGVITPSYLEAHGGVTFTIPEYLDRAPGDNFEVFWKSSPRPISIGPIGGFPLTFTLEAEVIEGFGEGFGELTYVLYDYAGNAASRDFTRTPIHVLLRDPPDDLKLPHIPQASGEGDEDDIIDLNEARGGAIVLIDEYKNAQAGDGIVVKLGNKEVDSTVLSIGYSFPIELELPYTDLMKHTDAPLYRENVSYYVARHFETASLPVAVDFDLRVVGPDPDPENPSPINDKLERATLIPPVSPVNNKLTLEDAGEPAIIRVQLYEGATTDDFLRVYYNGHLVPDSERQPTEEELAASVMDFELPWDVISDAGNGTRDVFYELSDGNWDGAHQRSPAQPVDVSAIALLTLAPPQVISKVTPGGFINCDSEPWKGIRVLLLDAANVREGDYYELHWHMNEIVDWSNPVEELVETTKETFTGHFTAAQVRSGVTIPVPWEPNIYPVVDGYVVMTWKTLRGNTPEDSEQIGQSAEKKVPFSRRTPSGCICDENTSCV
ncbi:hypothetical protein ACIQUS_13715 [Pseudomonas sp. NPDC090755]|uniref:hypothetical protein n=1 Tax=Pseudomonas sp. NPDC090755 TaxID=3364481 RepID=UPI00383B2462